MGSGDRYAVKKGLQSVRWYRQAFEPVPLVSGPNVHCRAEGLHLRRRHQAGMIVLMAGHRQTEALDGVGNEAGRPVIGR
jgi:hypothetical protein